jgi:hypothetical protein
VSDTVPASSTVEDCGTDFGIVRSISFGATRPTVPRNVGR